MRAPAALWDTHAVSLFPDVVLEQSPDGASPLGAVVAAVGERFGAPADAIRGDIAASCGIRHEVVALPRKERSGRR